MQAKRGVTLIELVLIMGIIGVLALVVIPKFDDYYAIDLRSAVKTLASDIKYAQSRAIAERVRYGLVFDPSGESYTVYRGNTSTPAEDFLKPGKSLQRSFSNIDLAGADFDGGLVLEFDAMGSPYNSSGTELAAQGRVILQRNGTVDTIKVYPLTGKVEF
jgi:type II secretory pathway pseudopilin PulG